MNKGIPSIALICILSTAGFSQNLVINPSFETFTACPLGPGSFGVQTWTQPYPQAGGCSTSDYYNACNTNGFADVPGNFLGTENALSGVGYAGIMLYESNTSTPCSPPNGNNYREYIVGSLSVPLVAGQTYSVSFHISFPENVMFASDDIGVYFSNSAVNLACPPPVTSTVLPYTPQLQYTGAAVTNVNGWTALQWIYTAAGGEQYLTIGNFKNDANTNGICANASTAYMFSYYYIDDVSVSITPPSSTLNTTASATNVLCNGQCTGTASASPASGTPPYAYLWSNGQTTSALTGLCAGNYSVTVTDAASASVTATVTVTQPTTLSATTSASPSACGGSTGAVTASASGGSPGYFYVWSNGSSQQSVSGLSAGTYTVIITDVNGCTQAATTTVVNANGPTVSASAVNTSCSGVNNGTATASASGGTTPYTYSWSNGASASSVTGLSAGNYTVTVTDVNGCSGNSIVTVSTGSGPSVTISTDLSISSGSSAGLNVTGGSTYSWSPATGLSCTTCSNPTASPDSTTQYCVIVTDGNGCSDTACVTVFILPEPIACGTFYLPNAFSPNNDEENDIFKAPIDPSCVVKFKLTIYSRWGEKVFESEDVATGWDGKLKNTQSNAGVYVFYCEAELTDGTLIHHNGNVSLIR